MSDDVAPVTTGPVLPEDVPVPPGRLAIRAWRAGDGALLGEAIMASLEHLRPWMAWIADEPLTVETREAMIERWCTERLAGGDAVYGIWRIDGERPVVAGGCGLHRRAVGRPEVLEIGYWLHVDHTGCGIATEAAAALTDTAFGVPGTVEVVIHHDPANLASGAVPARLGYVRQVDEACPVDGKTSATWSIDRVTIDRGTREPGQAGE